MIFSEVMNSEEIRGYLKNIQMFRGVFPSDRLPLNPENGIYIVNFDNSKNPGTHWVSIRIFDKKIEYFDPLILPIVPDIREFISSLNKNTFSTNLSQLQSDYSFKCGIFACGYVLLSSYYNLSLGEIINLFENKSISQSESLISDIFIYLIFSPNF